MRKNKVIAAGKFKANCLKLMDQVAWTRQSIVVTKSGVPVVKIIPVDEVSENEILGCMKGTFKVKGNIVSPVLDPKEWEVKRHG